MARAYETAIITGASSGIGWELAKALARDGTRVGLVARRVDRLQTLAGEIQQAGGSAFVASADLGQRQATLDAMKALREPLGPIDLLVANAGLGAPTDIEPFNTEMQEAMIRVNLLGVIYAIEGVLPEMLERRRGHIAAVSSLAAYKGLPAEGAYCASKAGLNAYLDGLRVQLRGRGVDVSTICPGFVATPMTAVNQFKMPFLLTAEEAARRIHRALKARKKVFNFPWPMYRLLRLARWVPDWALARIMAKYDKVIPRP